MTATAYAAGGPAAAVRWREWRTPALIVAFVLLAGVAVALLQPRPPVTGYLSPDARVATGTFALARILAGRGQHQQAVTSVAAAVAAATAGSTLVVTSPYLLTRPELRALGRTPASLVIVEPDSAALAALAPALTLAAGGRVGPLQAACPLRAATLAGPADMGGPGLRVRPGTPGVARCYVSGGLPSLVRFRSGGRLITVLSTGIPLTNAYLGRPGNAALAINLLSGGGQVTWLVPAVPPATGAAGAPRTFASVVPLAGYLVAVQLLLAGALAALWRGRRLGPLVAERLPVVVRASETVEGHGRLYRSRRARDRVAAVLRTAATARLAKAAGLPAGALPAAVTAALAPRSTLDEARLADLLYGPPPGSDAALVALAGDLDALEGEVRRQ